MGEVLTQHNSIFGWKTYAYVLNQGKSYWSGVPMFKPSHLMSNVTDRAQIYVIQIDAKIMHNEMSILMKYFGEIVWLIWHNIKLIIIKIRHWFATTDQHMSNA